MLSCYTQIIPIFIYCSHLGNWLSCEKNWVTLRFKGLKSWIRVRTLISLYFKVCLTKVLSSLNLRIVIKLNSVWISLSFYLQNWLDSNCFAKSHVAGYEQALWALNFTLDGKFCASNVSLHFVIFPSVTYIECFPLMCIYLEGWFQ